MVRVITQDTFDSVVKENIEDLEMGRKEAVEDAREQFVAQGVDLSNIVISDGADIPLTIKELQDLFADDGKCKDVKALASLCDTLATECRKGLAERVLATERAAYPAITRVLQIEDSAPSEDAKAARLSAMRAMGALMETNPDVLEGQGCKELFSGLGSGERAMEEASLEALLNCCVRHEHNRVNLVRNNLLDLLDTLSEGHPVRVSRVWQALVQDDDVRVPFGKAHDHARAIVEDHEALRKLCAAIQSGEFSYSEQTLLLSVLGSLTVRNEYCQAVVDQGMLKAILDLLSKEGQDRSIIKESLKLLKVLAGNDNVKNEIAALNGFAPVINSILNNLSVKSVCHAGCAVIAAVTLRSPDNAKQVMAAGGADLITQVMKTHANEPAIQTAAANAIRNVVSRSRELGADFLAADAESLLRAALATQPQAKESTRAALRDLGLDVKLTDEEWVLGAVKKEF